MFHQCRRSVLVKITPTVQVPYGLTVIVKRGVCASENSYGLGTQPNLEGLCPTILHSILIPQ